MGFLGQSREAKRLERQGGQEYNRLGRDYSNFRDDQMNQRRAAEGRSNLAFDKILGGYDDANGAFDDLDGIYRDWSKTGGIDPDDYNYSRGNYRNMVDTGGLSDENRARVRGNGVFDEFAKTGGWDDKRIANQRLRASATGSSMYAGLKSELDRKRAASGGFTPGDVYDASSQGITRDATRAADEANLNSELGIAAAQDEGRRWGASSLSGAETNLAGMESGNKLNALSGLNSLYGLRQQGRQFGAAGLGNTANARASLLDTLRQARADVPGEVGMYNQNILESLGIQGGQTEANLSGRRAYTPNRGFMDNLGVLAGAAAPFATGFLSNPLDRLRGRNQGINPRANTQQPIDPSQPWLGYR